MSIARNSFSVPSRNAAAGLGEVGGEVLGEPQQHLTPVR